MTTIYLINNSYTMNNLNFDDSESLESKREKRILSIEGEKESEILAKNPVMEAVNVIYSSPFVMALGTAKYLAASLGASINIRKELGERVLGNLGERKIRMVSEMQENDFNYKLSGGESLNDVKYRMLGFIKRILVEDEDKTIAVFSHNVAITCLLSEYCTKGFNLDNRLILNYQHDAIIDGAWDGINVVKLEFDKKVLENVVRVK